MAMDDEEKLSAVIDAWIEKATRMLAGQAFPTTIPDLPKTLVLLETIERALRIKASPDAAKDGVPTKEEVDEAVRAGERYADDMAAAMGDHPGAVWPVALGMNCNPGVLGDITRRAAAQQWSALFRAAQKQRP